MSSNIVVRWRPSEHRDVPKEVRRIIRTIFILGRCYVNSLYKYEEACLHSLPNELLDEIAQWILFGYYEKVVREVKLRGNEYISDMS